MTSVHIDFAPGSFWRSIARTATGTWIAGAIGLVLCVSVASTLFSLTHKAGIQQGTLQRLNAQLAERMERKPASKKIVLPEAQALAINRVVLQLNLPWRDLLDAIEDATPPNVALLSLEPDSKKHTLRGTAEAKSSDDMIAYIEELKKQDFFDNVTMLKHEVNTQDPNRPLRFQFEAQWAEQKQ